MLGGKCLGGKRQEANDGGQTSGGILTARGFMQAAMVQKVTKCLIIIKKVYSGID